MSQQILNPVRARGEQIVRSLEVASRCSDVAGRLARAALACLASMMLSPSAGLAQRHMDDPPAPPADQASLPEVRVADLAMREGNDGASLLRFRVTLSRPSSHPITLHYRVEDGTALWGDGDYQPIHGSVTIPAEVAATEIPVTVFGDKAPELDETVRLVVTEASNARVGRGVATGTITNDDSDGGGGSPRRMLESGGRTRVVPDPLPPAAPSDPPTWITIQDEIVPEGNDGTTHLRFRVRLSRAVAVPVVISYRLVDRTARRDLGDYQESRGTVTIPAGMSRSEIAVTVFGDEMREADETFEMVVEEVGNAAIENAMAVGTIGNDDYLGGGGGPRRMLEGGSAPAGRVSFGLACANPVRGRLGFRFALPRASEVSLELYDLTGRRVGEPFAGSFAAGTHVQAWTQDRPAPGVYLARFRADGQTVTQRISWLD